MSDKPKAGVRRKVTFTAHCNEGSCALRFDTAVSGWLGEERDYKGDAQYDLAVHNTDVHGGTPRLGDTGR